MDSEGVLLMEAPRCPKCGNPMKLERHGDFGDLQARCTPCKMTIYPLPKLSKEDDRQADADTQQSDIEDLIRLEGAPCRPRRKE